MENVKSHMQGQIRGLDHVVHMYYCGMCHDVRNEVCLSSRLDQGGPLRTGCGNDVSFAQLNRHYHMVMDV